MAGDGVAFQGVADFANTYPGQASGVVADASNGYGSDVGGQSVIVNGPTPPGGPYYILMENGVDYILQEDGGKIELES